jgi:osmoprotectant transport system substrate-binding protein
MKRTPVFGAVLAAVALALTACGSSGSSQTTTSAAAGGGSGSSSSGCPTGGASASGSSSAAAGGGGSASASFPAGTGSITVGSADFPESTLLADIYGDAMQAKGVTVKKKLNIGERAAYLAALNDGSIDFFPEYTGSILYYLDKSATAKKPDEVFSALQQKTGAKLTVLNYSAAQDSDTITVTQDTASKYKLSSIADLCPVASKLKLGAPAQFQTRSDGVPALKSVYGVTFGTFVPLSAGGTVTVTALKNSTVDAADIFSTDPAIAANKFVSLSDPQNMFAAQNIVPLVTKAKVTQTIADAANAVSAKLDTKTLAELVTKVQTDKQDPETVAKGWLSANNLG